MWPCLPSSYLFAVGESTEGDRSCYQGTPVFLHSHMACYVISGHVLVCVRCNKYQQHSRSTSTSKSPAFKTLLEEKLASKCN